MSTMTERLTLLGNSAAGNYAFLGYKGFPMGPCYGVLLSVLWAPVSYMVLNGY